MNKTKSIPDCRASLAWQERGKQVLPGLSQLLSKRPDQFAPGVWPGYFSRAKGVEVWDLDDNRYVDMSIGGIGANVLGYGDPDVDAAVRGAIDRGTSSSLNCPEDVTLAELLCELHPWAEKVRLARMGGEAMAMAVRIARVATGRDKIAFCGYHGWHDWYLAANLGTENALGDHLLSGLSPRGVPRGLTGTALPFHYNKLDELRSIIENNKNDIAAVVMEPIRGEEPQPGFLEGVKDIAAECGAVFIFDEISSGFRMNCGGAHMKLGVEPDMAVFSKALGNGYPIAAIIGKSDIMEASQNSFISSTYWTERIGPTAAIATIKKFRECDAGSHLMAIGRAVQDGWRILSDKHSMDLHVGGIPPLSHFTIGGDDAMSKKALMIQLMLAEGFLCSTSFYSMLTHTLDHVRSYLDALDSVLAEVSSLEKSGELSTALIGAPATAGFKRLA